MMIRKKPLQYAALASLLIMGGVFVFGSLTVSIGMAKGIRNINSVPVIALLLTLLFYIPLSREV